MGKYKHFVLIRFNVRLYGRAVEILNEDYLEKRFYLFEKYTLPSLLNQTCQNFSVLLFFHKETPQKFLDRINKISELSHPLRIITLLFYDREIQSGEKFVFPDFIRSEQSSPDEYFITSRLDNDDAYEKTYIVQIQNFIYNLPEKKTCIITFPHGEQFDIASNQRQTWFYDVNHFTSMFAPAETNILQYNHGRIKNSGHEIIYLETNKPMWTEIIHQLNFANVWISKTSKENISGNVNL